MLRSENTKSLISAFGLVGVTVAAGCILSSSYTFADDTVIDDVAITVPISCTMSGSGMTSHVDEVPNGTYHSDIGSTTLTAFCNDDDGFSIYATGYTGDTIGGTNSNKLVGTAASGNATIVTGTATTAGTPDVSNWAMKLAITQDSGDTTGTNALTINSDTEGTFSSYHTIPNTYTKVAHKNSATNMDTTNGGAKLTTTYAAYISKTQPADTYTGQVIYTLVHPVTEEPLQPQTAISGCINYFANASTAEGTMGCQSISASATSATLFASNFSRTGYGFAGWSDAYDYVTNANAHFYGPNEDITFTAGQYTGTNPGLSLYAVWVKSAGNLQDSSKVAELCGTGNNSLTAATYNNMGDEDESTWSITAGLSSVSALTDTRDNQTYAIAKLTDGNCWMIENLRLADTHQEGSNTVATTLTITNTNNPLNDGTNVTLKHNYTDTDTYNTLSATNNQAYNADTAPDGWCTTISAACYDQSRLRTDNTANRVSYATTATTMSTDASLYSYGNYYNWYSATAGRGTYSTGSDIVTAGDLCPAGWHLPYGGSGTGTKGGNTTGGFYYLANSMVATTSNARNSKKHRTFPNNYLYSGYVNGGSLTNRGTYGDYWSSTAYNNNYAYDLYLYSFYVTPGTNTYLKYNGRTLRCIASS